jgi:serine/threonine protein kinase
MVKILDFGIAKEPDTPVVEQTDPGTILGSPSYVSPEQAADDGSIDHRSDLWSMAIVLYQMLTGVLPFSGPTMGSVLRKVFMEPPPRMADVAPDLPPELDAFFDKALAKRPSERFSSIDEMLHAFLAIAAPDLEAPVSSLPVPRHSIVQAGDTTPPCGEQDLAPTVREPGVLHVVSAVPVAAPLDKPDSPAAKSSLGRSSRRRKARPWLFAAAMPAAVIGLILRDSADAGPDVGPVVVLTDERPPHLSPTFVPPPAAPVSPGNEPSAAAPRETKPTSPVSPGNEPSAAAPRETKREHRSRSPPATHRGHADSSPRAVDRRQYVTNDRPAPGRTTPGRRRMQGGANPLPRSAHRQIR